MPPLDLQTRIDRLAGFGPIKAWSVVVTILGDLCRSRDDWISAPVLNALTGRLGISAQASRVAIHRLKRDGWVESERAGRGSRYRLSATGWSRTEDVRPRIYATAPPRTDAVLIVGPPDLSQAEFADLLPDEAVIVGPRVALAQDGAALDGDFFSAPVRAGTLPAWVAATLVDAEIASDLDALAQIVDAETTQLPSADPVSVTTLRLAVLHHWRRLCLRNSRIADSVAPPGWPGDRARRAVTDALERLPRPNLGILTRDVLADRRET